MESRRSFLLRITKKLLQETAPVHFKCFSPIPLLSHCLLLIFFLAIFSTCFLSFFCMWIFFTMKACICCFLQLNAIALVLPHYSLCLMLISNSIAFDVNLYTAPLTILWHNTQNIHIRIFQISNSFLIVRGEGTHTGFWGDWRLTPIQAVFSFHLRHIDLPSRYPTMNNVPRCSTRASIHVYNYLCLFLFLSLPLSLEVCEGSVCFSIFCFFFYLKRDQQPLRQPTMFIEN